METKEFLETMEKRLDGSNKIVFVNENIEKSDEIKSKGSKLEMIQSNVQDKELTKKVMFDLILTQKMTHFQMIENLQSGKDITLLEITQLYSFLTHLGYSKVDDFTFNDLSTVLNDLKREYTFDYLMEPNHIDGILTIYSKKRDPKESSDYIL